VVFTGVLFGTLSLVFGTEAEAEVAKVHAVNVLPPTAAELAPDPMLVDRAKQALLGMTGRDALCVEGWAVTALVLGWSYMPR